MSPRIVAFGELLWDLLPSGAQLGGAPANFALRAQGVGCKVSLVTRIGNDAYGKEALATLKTLGLDTSCVQIDERLPTGTVDVQLSEQGNASYHIVKNVAYDHIALVPELEELSSTVDLICFGTLSQRALVSRSTLYSFIEMCPRAIKLVDINLRKECYSPETVRRSLELSDILKLNSDEVTPVCSALGIPELTVEQFCEYMFEKFSLTHVLVTRGAQGVYGGAASGERVDIQGYAVDVVDTIGSGDAFTAGFVSGLLTGVPFSESCDFGNRLGAAVATKKGGMSPCSTAEARAL